MRPLKRIESRIEELRAYVEKTAPKGSGITSIYSNIHIEHYSKENKHRLILDNFFFTGGTLFPFRVTVGEHGVKVQFRRLNSVGYAIAKRYHVREYLDAVFIRWASNDSYLWHLLNQML